MAKRFIQGLVVGSLAAGFLSSQYHPIQLRGQFSRTLFSAICSGINLNNDEKSVSIKQKMAYNLLWYMIRWKFFRNVRGDEGFLNLDDKVLEAGFDEQGLLLPGLSEIGMGGVQVGPVRFKSTNNKFGITAIKANVMTFLEKTPGSKLKIGLKIEPDEQVVEYTPYIIKENIINSISELYSSKKKSLINFITISTAEIESNLEDSHVSAASESMKKSLKQNAANLSKKYGFKLFSQGMKDKEVGVHKRVNCEDAETLQFYTWKNLLRDIIQ